MLDAIDFIVATMTGSIPTPAIGKVRHISFKAPRKAAPKARTKSKPRPYVRPPDVKPQLTRAQIADIVRRYQAGESRADIAKRFDIHPHTVWTHIKRQTRE